MKKITFILSILIFTLGSSSAANARSQLDTSFNPNPSAGVGNLELQADGKILVAGSFTSIAGVTLPSGTELDGVVVRLNSDGSLDESFEPFIQDGIVTSIAIQANGQILVGSSNGLLSRVDTDGFPDEDYQPQFNGSINDIIIQDDGLAIVGGAFTQVNGVSNINGLTRLEVDGSNDINFESSLIQVQSLGGEITSGRVDRVAFHTPLNSLLIAGNFTLVGGERRYMIARLGPDGPVDTSFDPVILNEDDDDLTALVSDLEVLPDGKIIIGGRFQIIDGFDARSYARLNLDGTFDSSFDVGAGTGTTGTRVTNLALQADGKVLLAGLFQELDRVRAPGFGRLNSDGTPDELFRAEPGSRFEYSIDGTISDILVESNGDILVSTSRDLVRIKPVSGANILPPIILQVLEEE